MPKSYGSPREKAYAEIKRALLRGDYAPAQMLSLRDLSERYGCPIAAIRDAVIRLECERMLKVHPQRGIQVMDVDLDFVREAYQLRLMIEREGARRVVDEPDIPAIDELERRTAAAIKELSTVSTAAAVERAVTVDWDMHQLIVGALRSQLVSDIYRQNRERQRIIGRVYAFHPAKYARAALVEHLPVLAALKASDAARALELIEAHITSAMRRQIGV
ncbi:MAG: GntR family transcriptional regulator [Burkholderiaceae bacterium]